MGAHDLQRAILARYDEIARGFARATSRGGDAAGSGQAGSLPEASGLGCARLPGLVDLFPGEALLDLGSGPGLETIALARLVEPAPAYGLDALPSMVEVATQNARRAGVSNVTFLTGPMEAIPLPDQSVDVVVSNCVVNLSPDKARVMAEVRRVLRPGGRIAIADMVWLSTPPPWVRNAADVWACCVGGALEAAEYPALLEAAGFTDVSLRLLSTTHPTTAASCCSPAPGAHRSTGATAESTLPGLGSALVTARKPGTTHTAVSIRKANPADLPLVERILQAARLPTAGVAEHLDSFLLACAPDGTVVGMVGLERYPSCALLRSLVVLPSRRGQGLGRHLVKSQIARLAPGTPVYLLTTDAREYFRSFGFRPVPRHQACGELAASAEFRGACPDSATLMALL